MEDQNIQRTTYRLSLAYALAAYAVGASVCAMILFSSSLKAGLNNPRIFHSYLVKVTNNSSKMFRLYCSNKDWDTVLYLSPAQLDTFPDTFGIPSPKGQELYDSLIKQRNIRIGELTVDQKTDQQIEQDPQMKALNAQIKPVEDTLRPVVKPHSVADNLPCRIFGAEDTPTKKPSRETALGWYSIPRGWHAPETVLKGDGIKIEFVDTNKQNGCPRGRVKITAKSSAFTATLCADNTLYYGRIHLIIEENGTFSLEQLTDIPLQK